MNNKILYGVIAVLAVILVLQTGYLIGKNQAVVIEETEVVPVKTSLPQAISNTVSPANAAVPSVTAQDEEIDFDEEVAKMQRSMSRLFSRAMDKAMSDENINNLFGVMTSFDPAIDIKETDRDYVVVMDVPGVDKETINIDVKPNYLVVSGERVVESEEEDNTSGYYKSERKFGSFSKTIPLVNRVVPEKVTAENKSGVLIITLPKEMPKLPSEDEGVKVPVQ